MIYLNSKDILDAVNLPELLDTIEQALLLYETGDFLMPQRMHIDHQNNTLLLMPCFTKDSFATKLVTLFPENPKLNLPVLNGIVVLNDIHTGIPLAILDGPVLTALRTAAVAGVAIRHLSPPETTSYGIIGAGVQGFYQAWMAGTARQLTDIYIYDLDGNRSTAMAARLSKHLPKLAIHPVGNVNELIEACQTITTATTAHTPVLPDDRTLLQGKHFSAIGSYQPHVREIPQSLYELINTLYIDTNDAIAESGDIIHPLQKGWITNDKILTLGHYLNRQKTRSTSRDETTFFKSVGMALFDVTAAKLIYDQATKKSLGREMDL